MQYYINGISASAAEAKDMFMSAGLGAGHDKRELAAIWNGRRAEEMRDIIVDCGVEIVAS